MLVPRKNDKASHKMQTVKPWKNDWTFALNISHRAQCVSTRDKKFLGGKTTKYSPVNIFSAIKCARFWGLDSILGAWGKLTTRCKGDGNIKSAAKILTSTIMDFKRKVEDQLCLLLVPSTSLYSS